MDLKKPSGRRKPFTDGVIDIRRWKIAKDVVDKVWMKTFTGVNIRQRGFPDNFYLWPIPQAEIDLNPALEQNPGWNN